MTKIDPVTVEIIRGALTYAAEEMGIVLRNSSYSPNIKERMDHSCAIFDPKKRLVAQAEHIPVHLGSLPLGVVQALEKFDEELEPGDMILLNDPYVAGTHLPDLTLINPVFYEGELIGYTANKAHHSDVGGKAPGSMAGDATELYQEGLIIPPIKFVRKGKIERGPAQLITSNVRTPKVTMGDIRAQIAANVLGERRLIDVTERYGVNIVQTSMEEIINYSERRMRREIDSILEGSYVAEDYLEDIGTSDKPLKVKVTIAIKGDHMEVDYTGTDKQVDGPVNAVLGVTLSGVYYVLKCVTDPSIPTNDGCYRPVNVFVPRGTALNPIPPAPVAGGNVETSQRNVDALLRAFAQAVPEKVCAACQGTMNNVAVGGSYTETGMSWSFYETIAGGFGGRQGLDGVDGVHVHMTNTMNTPIEAIERTFPIRFLKYELRKDSCGPGKWRGGSGIERSWTLLAPYASLSILAERNKTQPWGLYGGKPGAVGEYYVVKPDGTKIKLKSKCNVRMEAGDTLLVKTPGGGGYGDPLERDPDLVAKDLVNGLISVEHALKNYRISSKELPIKTPLKLGGEATKIKK